jgi:TorA maturation chaperone TorD
MTQYHQRLVAGDYAPAPSEADLEEATLVELREQLTARGLPTSGNKKELIDRLATPPAETE